MVSVNQEKLGMEDAPLVVAVAAADGPSQS